MSTRPKNVPWMSVAAGLTGLAAIGILFFFGADRLPKTVQAAIDQHQREVVSRSKTTWMTDPEEIQILVGSMYVPTSSLDNYAPAGFRLDRANLCKLNNHLFAHLVFANGQDERSIFVTGIAVDDFGRDRDRTVGGTHVVASHRGGVAVIAVN